MGENYTLSHHRSGFCCLELKSIQPVSEMIKKKKKTIQPFNLLTPLYMFDYKNNTLDAELGAQIIPELKSDF